MWSSILAWRSPCKALRMWELMIIASAFVIKDLATTIFSDFARVALKFVKLFVISDFTWNVLLHKISIRTPHKVLCFASLPHSPPLGISVSGGHQAPSSPSISNIWKYPCGNYKSVVTWKMMIESVTWLYCDMIEHRTQSAESEKCVRDRRLSS